MNLIDFHSIYIIDILSVISGESKKKLFLKKLKRWINSDLQETNENLFLKFCFQPTPHLTLPLYPLNHVTLSL